MKFDFQINNKWFFSIRRSYATLNGKHGVCIFSLDSSWDHLALPRFMAFAQPLPGAAT